MTNDEVVKVLKRLVECSASDRSGMPYYDEEEKQAVVYAVETLKRIDAEKIQKLLSYQHELCSKRISQQIVNYLRGE